MKLQSLYCVQSKIKDLEPLRVFRFLNEINLMSCEAISSIDDLIYNKDLKKLDFSYTKVENIEVLKNFIELEELDLSAGITTIEPLTNLLKLRRLCFRHAFSIQSLEPLRKLSSIEYLVISDTIEDLTPIDHFQKIQRIVCYGVSEKEAIRFRATHPGIEMIYGEEEKLKSQKFVERIRDKAKRVREEGLNEEEKKIFGVK